MSQFGMAGSAQSKFSGGSEIVVCEPFHITADKEEIKDFTKFAYQRISFIRKTVGEIALSLVWIAEFNVYIFA